jgi:hypothetical protein
MVRGHWQAPLARDGPEIEQKSFCVSMIAADLWAPLHWQRTLCLALNIPSSAAGVGRKGQFLEDRAACGAYQRGRPWVHVPLSP